LIEQLNHPFVHCKIRSGLDLVSLQTLSSERFKTLFPGNRPYNTDRHPYLEYAAPRAFYVGSNAALLDRDERLVRRGQSRLFVASALGDRALDREELLGLIRVFQAPIYASEKRLQRALLGAFVDRYGIDSAAAAADTSVRMVATLLTRSGGAQAYQDLERWLRKISQSKMSLRDWRDYYAFEAEQLRYATSVFTEPDTTRFAFAHAQCAGLLPAEAAKFESRTAALYAELGISRGAAPAP